MSPAASLQPFRNHEASRLSDLISQHVGLDCDLIQLTLFLSLTASALGMPINLEIWTATPEIDLQIVHRIVNFQPDLLLSVDTHTAFRQLERSGFKYESGTTAQVVLTRSDHKVFRDALLYSTRVDASPPSMWHVCHADTRYPPLVRRCV